MKTLRLAFSRIFTYFLENKLIFILFFIGTITCVLSITYYYGNVLNYKTSTSPYDNIELKSYNIYFSQSTYITREKIEQLKNFSEDYEIQDICIQAIIDTDGNNVDFSDAYEAIEYYNGCEFSDPQYSDIIILSTYMYNNNYIVKNPKAEIFTEEQLKQHVAAAPKEKSGGININGESFEIVKNEMIANYCIPADAFFDSNIKAFNITIFLSEPFSENMMYKYREFLNETFSSVSNSENSNLISIPEKYLEIENEQIGQEFKTIIFVFAISIISFMFLLKYLMDSCRRENSIYMMVGAKKRTILLINFIENLSLTLVCTTISLALHILLYDVLFVHINLYENIVYTYYDYLLIAGLVIIISTIIQIPFMFSYWYKNIKKIKEGIK